MTVIRLFRFLALACVLAVPTVAASTLIVEVVDPTGAAVPAADVMLETPAGAVVDEAETDAEGRAALAAPRSGVYRARVLAPGFETLERRTSVTGAETVIQIRLELSTVSTTLEVEAPAIVASPAVVVPAAELDERPATDLVDNLRDTPGVNVLRRGGTNFEPVVFGLRETQVAMTVDATRAFAAGPGRMDSELSHVEPGHVEEVRVVNGPYALTQAAGALAAITVTTPDVPRPDDWRFGGRLSAGYGSNGSTRFGRTRVFGAGRTFGFSLRAAGNQGNDYIPGDERPAVPGDYENHQFGGKLRFNPIDGQELTLSGLYDEQTGVDFPGRLLRAEHFLMRQGDVAYYIRNLTPAIRSIRLNLYSSKKSHRMSNDGKPTAFDMPGRMPPFALRVDLPTESDTYGGAGSIEFEPQESWRVQTGFDFYLLRQDAQRFVSRRSDGSLIFSDAVWPDAEVNDQGLYAQTTKAWESGEVSAAVRFDFVQADAGRPTEFFLANTSGEVDRSETNVSFSLAGRRRIGDGLSVGGGFGRVVRTANALERYSDRFPSTKFQNAAEFLGAPDIRPEASYQGDLNLQYRTGAFSLQGGGFYRWIYDAISVAPDPSVPRRLPLSPPVAFRYVNADKAVFRGYYFGARYWLSRLLELRVRGSKTIADEIAEDVPLIGRNEPVLGIPPLEVTASARLYDPTGRIWAEYSARNAWDQRRVAASRLESRSPGFSVHAFRVGVTLPGESTLHAGVENLGDRYYFEHLNSLNPFQGARLPEPGRNFFASLTTRW